MQKISEIIPLCAMGAVDTESPIEKLLYYELMKLRLNVETQKEIGRYRVDILKDKAVIECDGQAFHQDREREAMRDSFLNQQGYRVIHVTGRNIYKNARYEALKICNGIGHKLTDEEQKELDIN